MSVIVYQVGARHRYAVPRLLQEAGLLAALFTDSCDRSTLGRLAPLFAPFSATARKLAARCTTGIPPEKIFATDILLWQRLVGSPADTSSFHCRIGTHGASAAYVMWGTPVQFLEHCRHKGLKIILDMFIDPYAVQREEEEYAMHPWLPDRTQRWPKVEALIKSRLPLASIILCPSEGVAEGVRKLVPEVAARIRVIPYGSSIPVVDEPPDPVVGRILFVGTEFVRKGLVYLAEAARIVRSQHPSVQILVAGLEASSAMGMPHADQLTFLGRLPLNEIHEEFCRADIFTLPSLAEGQAGVVLEALASGCPVVTTREAGIDLDPYVNGILVPIRDPQALADALLMLVTNRELRESIASNGLMLAREKFSAETWKSNLIELITQEVRPSVR